MTELDELIAEAEAAENAARAALSEDGEDEAYLDELVAKLAEFSEPTAEEREAFARIYQSIKVSSAEALTESDAEMKDEVDPLAGRDAAQAQLATPRILVVPSMDREQAWDASNDLWVQVERYAQSQCRLFESTRKLMTELTERVRLGYDQGGKEVHFLAYNSDDSENGGRQSGELSPSSADDLSRILRFNSVLAELTSVSLVSAISLHCVLLCTWSDPITERIRIRIDDELRLAMLRRAQKGGLILHALCSHVFNSEMTEMPSFVEPTLSKQIMREAIDAAGKSIRHEFPIDSSLGRDIRMPHDANSASSSGRDSPVPLPYSIS